MPHRISCVWSVCGQPGRRFDQPLTRWFFCRFEETHGRDAQRNRKKKQQQQHEGTFISKGRARKWKKVHLLPCYVLRKKKSPWKASKLCLVYLRSMSLATRPPEDACHKVSTLSGNTRVAELKPLSFIFCYWIGKIKPLLFLKRVIVFGSISACSKALQWIWHDAGGIADYKLWYLPFCDEASSSSAAFLTENFSTATTF